MGLEFQYTYPMLLNRLLNIRIVENWKINVGLTSGKPGESSVSFDKHTQLDFGMFWKNQKYLFIYLFTYLWFICWRYIASNDTIINE
jgi:hypothetical protein